MYYYLCIANDFENLDSVPNDKITMTCNSFRIYQKQ